MQRPEPFVPRKQQIQAVRGCLEVLKKSTVRLTQKAL
jgi:hypothetical protein